MKEDRAIDKDAFTTERPSPLELIARAVGTSSYRVPVEGTSTKPTLRTSDIVAAVGYMGDRLEQQVTLAVATRAEASQIARMSALAYRRVARVVRALPHRPLDLAKGADRWKLRIVVADAAYHLVWPERRPPMSELARQAKMRRATYCDVYLCASSVLQEQLSNATDNFRRALWGGG